ncbi:MAG: PAS domain-containing protein [Gammaproteobacteria bacterium]|nr:PAS domain-containing protein [Gammaproteobacteria bacterium]
MNDFMVSLPAVLYEYVLYADHSSEFLYVSPQSQEILGYTNEYFLEDMNNFWNLVDPEDLERLKNEDITANKQNDFFISTVRIKHPTKGQVWIQISSRPTERKKNNTVIWIGYMIDITDKMNLAADLEQVNRKLEALSFSDGLTGLLYRRAFDEALHNSNIEEDEEFKFAAAVLPRVSHYRS